MTTSYSYVTKLLFVQNRVGKRSAYFEYKAVQILEISVICFLTYISHKVKGQAFQETCLKLEDGTDCCSENLVMTTNWLSNNPTTKTSPTCICCHRRKKVLGVTNLKIIWKWKGFWQDARLKESRILLTEKRKSLIMRGKTPEFWRVL